MRCYRTIHQQWTRYNCAVCTLYGPQSTLDHHDSSHHTENQLCISITQLKMKLYAFAKSHNNDFSSQILCAGEVTVVWDDLTIVKRSLNIGLYCSTVIHHNFIIVGDWNVNNTKVFSNAVQSFVKSQGIFEHFDFSLQT